MGAGSAVAAGNWRSASSRRLRPRAAASYNFRGLSSPASPWLPTDQRFATRCRSHGASPEASRNRPHRVRSTCISQKEETHVEDNTPYIPQDDDDSRSAGYFVAAGDRQALSQSPNEKPNVACIGVGGKGGSDSANAAKFGNVIAICDVDRNTLESKGNAEGFKDAEKFTDYRELLAKHGKNIDIATISTPDHMHAPATLEAMRLGISCYTQKPLTRTIYEARLLGQGRRRDRRVHPDGQSGNGPGFLPRGDRPTSIRRARRP